MNKKTALTVFVTALIVFGLCFGYYSIFLAPRLAGNGLASKLNEIERLIDEHAIKAFDKEKAYNAAAAYYVYTLDDVYCGYFEPVAYTDYIDSQQGNFTGIGLKVSVQQGNITDGLRIVRVLGNSPSEEAGLKAMDLITAVDGKNIIGEDYNETLNMILGEEGTQVTLTVERDGVSRDVTVSRLKFTQREVDYRVINGEIGFIRIHNFNINAYTEFRNAVTALLDMNVKGFIFDVRNNPGGELNTVKSMVDILVDEDELVVLQYKNEEVIYKSTSERLTDLPMAVLINAGSASASELFASALRDLNAAPLIGDKSYGKGVGQTTYSLSDGSAVKMTTFTYVTKSRTNYDSIGLEPDVAVSLDGADTLALYTLDESNDEQLIAALDTVNALIK